MLYALDAELSVPGLEGDFEHEVSRKNVILGTRGHGVEYGTGFFGTVEI